MKKQKYKKGDKVVFKDKHEYGKGYDLKEATITKVERFNKNGFDDFFYHLDYTRRNVPVFVDETLIVKKIDPKKPTTMTRKRTTTKAHESSNTMRYASRILKAQKDDYKKIFAAEVKKSKDPKAGAKKAGKIYRDRYGATATARWKKALKRAK